MHRIFMLSICLLFSQIGTAQNLPQLAEDIAPLLVGEIFPDSGASNMEGTSIQVQSLLDDKPAIVVFYRGGWCPYCNRHLAELAQIESQILDLGYQIIAVSPDAPVELNKTLDKNGINYTLLSDGSGALAKAAGIAFQAPDRYGDRLSKYSDGANEGYLPVPAVFVINPEREILFEYISPNYKQRMSGAMLMAVLENL